MQSKEHATVMTISLSENPSQSKGGVEPQVSHGTGVDEGVGNLTFDQYTTGGLGRHLGIVSTTFLMYELYQTGESLIGSRVAD